MPRPDTETLVEAALARLSPKTPTARTPTGKTPTPLLVADVGCGSGAVALGPRLAAAGGADPRRGQRRARAGARRRNVRETGFGERVRVVGGDLLTAVGSRALDAVAANLPYIPDGEIAGLDPEVRDHEPRSALAGGPDGLDPLRRLASGAARALREGGELFVGDRRRAAPGGHRHPGGRRLWSGGRVLRSRRDAPRARRPAPARGAVGAGHRTSGGPITLRTRLGGGPVRRDRFGRTGQNPVRQDRAEPVRQDRVEPVQ